MNFTRSQNSWSDVAVPPDGNAIFLIFRILFVARLTPIAAAMRVIVIKRCWKLAVWTLTCWRPAPDDEIVADEGTAACDDLPVDTKIQP